MRVLLVDDNKTVLKIHTKMVEDLGHEVVATAEDGEEALSLYQEIQPDLVISDIDMPKMNGIQMTEEIVAHDNFAKIILVSSFEKEEHLSQALQSETVDYVTKPIKPDDLKAILDRIERGS